jgi:hypothetical protein
VTSGLRRLPQAASVIQEGETDRSAIGRRRSGRNSEIVSGNLTQKLTDIKAQDGGDIAMFGRPTARWLLREGLKGGRALNPRDPAVATEVREVLQGLWKAHRDASQPKWAA